MTSNNNADVPEVPADAEALQDLSTSTSKTEHAPADPLRPPSILSAETSASRPSWYATWIGWGTSIPRPAPLTAGDANAEPSLATNKVGEITEAEQIKAEALAGATEPTPPLPVAQPSPILTSDTRASWVSFFSSRSRAYTKTITDGSETKGEMEVMDIDEDDAPTTAASTATSFKETAQTPLTTPNKSKPSATPPVTASVNGKRPASPSPSAKAADRRTAPSPTPNEDGMPPSQGNLAPASPLTGSKDVKKQVPSTKTAKDASPKPKTPNLVLPTWGDTFYSAPRSVRPPTTTSTLKKTFDAVSRLLVTPVQPPNPELESHQQERKKRLAQSLSTLPSASPEMYEEEQRRMTRTVGTDLPRAWSILGDGIHGNDVGKMKRIAIIGIHGCVDIWIGISSLCRLTDPIASFAPDGWLFSLNQ